MNSAKAPQAVSAALVSVGGSPAPILHVLLRHRPGHVWYLCSKDSRGNADEVQRQLDWHPQARFIEIERFEELGPCYRELRRKLPEILKETGIAPPSVLVDYTCGTKTMSAALVMAAMELFQQFSYVGGEQREKGGLGVVVGGKERVLYQDNPWTALAIREIERARDLWDGCQFDAAGRVLREVASKVPCRLRFEAFADLADAMAARHRLDFKSAKMLLDRLQGQLPPLFDGREDYGLLAFARSAQAVCGACVKGIANNSFLRELLDNALRTAGQGRYEDAAARLYRAMEMQGQLWLAEISEEAFVNGRKRADVPLPVPLEGCEFCRPGPDGEVRLSLEQVFRATSRLGDSRADVIVADLERGKKSRWRFATEKRNASILAHGVNAIGQEGFETMKELAAEFLGFELAGEANPAPSLDSRWLE